MKFSILFLLFCSCLLTFATPDARGQDTTNKRPVVAVLVQLRSEHNRMEALKKAHEYKLMKELEVDAIGVQKAMIKDFTDNFTYCPVYYYMDTNADQVKNKLFTGVLMNADGTPVKKNTLDGANHNYLIAYYGYIAPVYKEQRTKEDSLAAQQYTATPFGKGLMILDDKFHEMTFFYKLAYQEDRGDKKKSLKEYKYNSKYFEIDYYPLVARFNKMIITCGEILLK